MCNHLSRTVRSEPIRETVGWLLVALSAVAIFYVTFWGLDDDNLFKILISQWIGEPWKFQQLGEIHDRPPDRPLSEGEFIWFEWLPRAGQQYPIQTITGALAKPGAQWLFSLGLYAAGLLLLVFSVFVLPSLAVLLLIRLWARRHSAGLILLVTLAFLAVAQGALLRFSSKSFGPCSYQLYGQGSSQGGRELFLSPANSLQDFLVCSIQYGLVPSNRYVLLGIDGRNLASLIFVAAALLFTIGGARLAVHLLILLPWTHQGLGPILWLALSVGAYVAIQRDLRSRWILITGLTGFLVIVTYSTPWLFAHGLILFLALCLPQAFALRTQWALSDDFSVKPLIATLGILWCLYIGYLILVSVLIFRQIPISREINATLLSQLEIRLLPVLLASSLLVLVWIPIVRKVRGRTLVGSHGTGLSARGTVLVAAGGLALGGLVGIQWVKVVNPGGLPDRDLSTRQLTIGLPGSLLRNFDEDLRRERPEVADGFLDYGMMRVTLGRALFCELADYSDERIASFVNWSQRITEENEKDLRSLCAELTLPERD